LRRVALLTVALVLGLCGSAAGFAAGYVTLSSKQPGAAARATIDIRLPRGDGTPYLIGLRMARGTKWHNRAVARRCRDAQAARDDCPAASRIGGGLASVETSPGGPRNAIDIDLYMARRRVSEDQTGVVLVARHRGRARYATGRVFELNPSLYPRKGLQLRVEGLRKAFFGMGLRDLNVHFGVHRTVDGRRVDLLTGPRSCPSEGWPWTIGLEARDGSGGFFHGTVNCSS
jgi:hypothetical protein